MVGSLLINDDIVSIDKVLLDLVRDDTLKWVDTECLGNLGNDLSDLGVGSLVLNGSLGSKHSVVSGQNDISLLSSDL